MTLGLAPQQGDLLHTTVGYCEPRVGTDSIYAVLNRECFGLFPDEMFADLFTDVGRRSVPPMIVAVVMVLQRIEGCSDREAVDRFTFDARWKYAAGGLAFDYPGFVHTVLVDMRARLAASDRPDRIFEATLEAAKAAGLVGHKRVLDSTPLYDAVATMDTVTLIRSGIRGVLKAAGADLGAQLRAVIVRDDDYAVAGKPVCDYDDAAARKVLVDALAKDGTAVLGVLDGRELGPVLAQAGALLATVLGQDLEIGVDGVFAIARRVAPDRVISTVDPQARHGHKTSAHRFDGYKGHIAIDPDAEVITATAVTAGNTGDAACAVGLLAADIPDQGSTDDPSNTDPGDDAEQGDNSQDPEAPLAVYGDAAYGAGSLLADLEAAGVRIMTKVQPPVAPAGRFAKDRFVVDTEAGTVTCPAGVVAAIGAIKRGWTDRGLRHGLRRVPPGERVYERQGRSPDPDRYLRGRARPGPRCPGRPRMAGRVPGHPTQGGTQDRPPDAPPPRRTTSPGPRTGQGRRRLLSTCCRGQPGPVRRPRTHSRIRAQMGGNPYLTRPGSGGTPKPGHLHCGPQPRTHTSPETQYRPTHSQATPTCLTRSPTPNRSPRPAKHP
jgi:hypothetical protein